MIEVIETKEVEREQKGSGSRTHQLPPEDSEGLSSREFARTLFPCLAQGEDAADDRQRSHEWQREEPEQWRALFQIQVIACYNQEIDEKQQEQEEEGNPGDLLVKSPDKGTGGFDFLHWLLRFDLLESLLHLGHVVRASSGISFQHALEVVLPVFGDSACSLRRDAALPDPRRLSADAQSFH